MMTPSLFGHASGWRDNPSNAFLELLASEAFRQSSRSSSPLPDGHTMRPDSAKVYTSMFERFLRYLASHQASLETATQQHIASFFDGELAGVSKETFARYLRLVERVYDHLVSLEFLTTNPVTIWVQEGLRAGVKPGAGRRKKAHDFVTAAQVNRLQDWLYTRGKLALHTGDWRQGRDLTLASLSLGSGLRFTELQLLKRNQVKHWPNAAERERFEFNIPGSASVATSRAHRTFASPMCAELFETWWLYRWSARADAERQAVGDLVFPATLSGKSLDKATVYKNLCAFAAEAVEAGCLDESSSWVLSRGAQGLRRAYVLTELATGRDTSLLTERLGHWQQRSTRRYEEQLQEHRKAQSRQPTGLVETD